MKYDCTKVLDYVHERNRMCKSSRSIASFCYGCPFYSQGMKCNTDKDISQSRIDIVQQWSDENPEKTKQDKFLKMFPNTPMRSDGIIDINPCWVDQKIKEKGCSGTECKDCREKYWSEVAK